MTASERVVKYIVDNEIDTKMLSEAIGVSESAINYWKKGRNLPSRNTVKKILDNIPYIDRDYVLHGRYKQSYTDPSSVEDADLKQLLSKSFKGMSSKFFIQKMKMIQHQSKTMHDAALIINELISDMLDDLDDQDFDEGKKNKVG